MSPINDITEGLPLPVIDFGTLIAYPNIPVFFDLVNEGAAASADKAEETDSTVLLTFSKDPDIFTPKTGDLFKVGVIAKIVGRVEGMSLGDAPRVKFHCICRARILSYEDRDGIKYGRVIPEEYVEPQNSVKAEALRRHILQKMRALSRIIRPNENGFADAKNIIDIGELSDYAATRCFLATRTSSTFSPSSTARSARCSRHPYSKKISAFIKKR